MARIDRLQEAGAIQHDEHIVDIGSLERIERVAKSARDALASLAETVAPLIRSVHRMRTQIEDLFEQMRILKQDKAA